MNENKNTSSVDEGINDDANIQESEAGKRIEMTAMALTEDAQNNGIDSEMIALSTGILRDLEEHRSTAL